MQFVCFFFHLIILADSLPLISSFVVSTSIHQKRLSQPTSRLLENDHGGEVELEVLIENEGEENEFEIQGELCGSQHQRQNEEEGPVAGEEILVAANEFEEDDLSETDQEQSLVDESYMRLAVEYVKSQKMDECAYPNPSVGAVLIGNDGKTLALGRSTFEKDAIQDVLEQAGVNIQPLAEWCITWPMQSRKLREKISSSTLYVTLEPLSHRRGETLPPLTQLIELSGIERVVIGATDPVPERAGVGAQALHHQSGLDVSMGRTLVDECLELIEPYIDRINSSFHKRARLHRSRHGRPLGLLHCSVIDSDDIKAFAQLGNTFGMNFGGKTLLSFRDFGSYEMAPPPEQIWAKDNDENDVKDLTSGNSFLGVDFDDEDGDDYNYEADVIDKGQRETSESRNNIIMPWYEQVDAVIATFPRAGRSGPSQEANTIESRLNGLKWLATFGRKLPAGIERILVMDATDLESLPVSNDDPNIPPNVDVEEFWSARGRKATRVILRKGRSSQAEGAAKAAAIAAEAAAEAAIATKVAIETGKAESAAEAAMEYQSAALKATEMIQNELSKILARKQKLQSYGVIVETLNGRDPIDVMKHLGKRNGYGSVVWRAGCWGTRGVQSIIDGAFQCVSAHLAVDAKGGKFWQQMLAERAVQGACGPESRVKVFANDDDVSLEFCDSNDDDKDCVLLKDGKPIRHVRLDCRVALYDKDRPREFLITPTKRIDRKIISEEAPWFVD